MSSVVISGDTSGAITLSAPAVAGTNTATLPAATGTVMVSGNMPAFEAYIASSQSVNTGSNTLLTFNTKVYDTANCFNTSTYAFTPNVAGYYQVNAYCAFGSNSNTAGIYLWKNGSQFRSGKQGYPATGYPDSNYAGLIYMNGTTDYIQIYCQVGANTATQSSAITTTFNACLVRAA